VILGSFNLALHTINAGEDNAFGMTFSSA